MIGMECEEYSFPYQQAKVKRLIYSILKYYNNTIFLVPRIMLLAAASLNYLHPYYLIKIIF